MTDNTQDDWEEIIAGHEQDLQDARIHLQQCWQSVHRANAAVYAAEMDLAKLKAQHGRKEATQ